MASPKPTWYQCNISHFEPSEQKDLPFLVFGPDLKQNLSKITDQSQFLQKHIHADIKNLPENLVNEHHNTKTENGTKFWNVSTLKVSRYLPKSGIHEMKPIMSAIRSYPSEDVTGKVNNHLVCVMALKKDLVPIARIIGSNMPMWSEKTVNIGKPRNLSINFVSVDDDNQSDKTPLFNLIDNVRNAARLTDTPCRDMHTAAFAAEARQVVEDLNDPRVSIDILQEEDLIAKGMNGIVSVGMAAVKGRRSRLAVLKFINGVHLRNVCLVGKGIVYDTGGLSIKSKTGMPGMKGDCGGAAGLLYGFKQAVQNGFDQNLYCLLCLAENAVGPRAYRPDDIIKFYSGKTVEINNTDAEGRVVLGDGVHYASKDLKADVVLNMCTLTGAQGITTGTMHAGIMTNRGEEEPKLVAAGLRSGDCCFPMLYAPTILIKEFESTCADMKNSVASRTNAQSSCAGTFIGAHLLDGFDFKGTWIHVDMAYPANGTIVGKDRATGYGVALVNALFSENLTKTDLFSE